MINQHQIYIVYFSDPYCLPLLGPISFIMHLNLFIFIYSLLHNPINCNLGVRNIIHLFFLAFCFALYTSLYRNFIFCHVIPLFFFILLAT